MLKLFVIISIIVAQCCCAHTPPFGRSTHVSEDDIATTVTSISGDITDTSLLPATMAVKMATRGQIVVIHISSPGGLVAPADSFIDRMNEAGLRGVMIYCVVDSIALSSAFFILEGCPARIARPWSQMMMHKLVVADPGHQIVPPDQLTPQEAYDLAAVNEAMANFLAWRMKMPVDTYKALVENGDWWMSASEALTYHAIDRVEE
jgi:ATP-dependent protease ClpP protease subunit